MLVDRSCHIILYLLFNLLKLLQPQPLAVGMRPPVNMATAPMVTPRTQSPGKILVGPQQLRQLTSGRSTCLLCQRCVWSVCRCDADTSVFPVGPPGRTGLLPVFKPVPPAAASCPAVEPPLRTEERDEPKELEYGADTSLCSHLLQCLLLDNRFFVQRAKT
jgi:hypothetical protein